MADKEIVRIEDFKGLRIAHLRDQGPIHHATPPLMRRLRAVAQQHRLHSPNAVYLSVIHDDPRDHEQGHARVDAAVSVAANVQPATESGLALYELDPGLYMVYRHVGPYKTLRDAWVYVSSLPMMRGYKLRKGPSFEIYRNDPAHMPEDQLITDLYQAVEAVG